MQDRLAGGDTMMLTREELAFLDVYCHEGSEPPFGGPATNALNGIGVYSGDTLNLQWAYLRDKPPSGPTIGSSSNADQPHPWANRVAVLRRDAEIGALREEAQRIRTAARPQARSVDGAHESVFTSISGD